MVTLSEVKAYLGITANTYDSLLTSFITYTTAEIEAYLDRVIVKDTITDEVLTYHTSYNEIEPSPVFGMRSETEGLLLQEWPVDPETIVVNYDGDPIDEDDFLYDITAGILNLFGTYRNKYDKLTATYEAGYDVADVPAALKLVALEGIKEKFLTSGTATQGAGNIKSKKVGDFSVTYNNTSELTLKSASGSSSYLKPYLALSSAILDKYARKV